VDTNYQLQVEDAARVAEHDVVVFADADTTFPDPFELRSVKSGSDPSFSSHVVTPGHVLALAREHFGAETPGYVLAIRGHEFDDYGERLSERARANLAAAVEFIVPVLRERRFPGGA
jgi:Ni,Fe-hydrogenase maturation factor